MTAGGTFPGRDVANASHAESLSSHGLLFTHLGPRTSDCHCIGFRYFEMIFCKRLSILLHVATPRQQTTISVADKTKKT